jgi:hypothetical protein
MRVYIAAGAAFFLGISFIYSYSTFSGFPARGVQKHHVQIFLQKVHVENFPQKNRQDFRCQMSVFPRLLLFYRGFGCFSAMGVQRFAKKIVSKSFAASKVSPRAALHARCPSGPNANIINYITLHYITLHYISKSVYKKIDKKSQTDFFSIFFSLFWAFLGEGSSKTP